MLQFLEFNPYRKMSITLQHIVQYNSNFYNIQKLYTYQEENKTHSIKKHTDTYINIFHNTRWRYLTNIENIWLDISCSGKGTLYLYGHQICKYTNTLGIEKKLLASTPVDSPNTPSTFRAVLNDCYDFFSFSWEYKKNEKFYILEAKYTAAPPLSYRPVQMAIVSTTYKRPKDIHNLVNIYKSACHHSPALQQSTHLFIINNDRLDKNIQTLQDNSITILDNPCNMGGAGGFARGAREAIRKGSFSHILFMDDDALVHEESWLRSICLLACLKESFYENPISGAMFRQDRPTFCQTMGEALDSNFHRILTSGEALLESSSEVCSFLAAAHHTATQSLAFSSKKKTHHPYAAWWYAIFPVSIFQKYGYPSPYFFRGDDQEFGIRIGKSPLFLNGICIWHPPFGEKVTLLRQYLGLRNHLLTVARHHRHWKRLILREVFNKMSRSLANKDYESAAAYLQAVKDFFAYPRIPQDGERLIPRLQTVISSYQNRTIALPQKKQLKPQAPHGTWIYSLAVWLSAGGAFIPSRLRRPYAICHPQQISSSWAAQCVAWPNEGAGRQLQTSLAVKLWWKTLFLLLRILLARKKFNK